MKKGTHHSDVTKEKIKIINIGKHISSETKKKIGNALRGRKHSLESIKKMTEAQNRPDVKEKNRISHLGHIPSADTINKIRFSETGKIVSLITCERLRKSHLGKKQSRETIEKRKKTLSTQVVKNKMILATINQFNNPQNRKKASEANKLYWNAPGLKEKQSQFWKEYWTRSEYVRKQMKSRQIKPNKLELFFQSFLDSNFSGEWKYVGDGELVIGGKCPDFVRLNSKKLLIELFGDYWHKGENPQDRITHFANYGYDCLVIWENEVYDNSELIKLKIKEFDEH